MKAFQIDPDTNPTYQDLITMLFALNCMQSSYAYSIQPLNETECIYSCSLVGGHICFESEMNMDRALARIKSSYAKAVKIAKQDQ